MGGKLLHHWGLPEKRVGRADFDRVVKFVVNKLDSHFCKDVNRRVEPLGFFAEKQDFGDLDVAMEVFSGENVNFVDELEKVFGFKPHKNGNCVSFPVEGFQVDVLLFSNECWENALTYYKFESGNLMGRLADQMGLSYGHRGLYLQVPLNYFDSELPDHEYAEVLVSRDPKMVFYYLGFDYERFKKGFKNFEEMSLWVAESKYFSPQVFAFDALNHINRTRNRKRPVYAKFVEWCEQQPARQALPSKKVVREELLNMFECVREGVKAASLNILLNKARRDKFNGKLVNKWTGAEGKALGNLIVGFKKQFEDFNDFLDVSSKEVVHDKFCTFYYWYKEAGCEPLNLWSLK